MVERCALTARVTALGAPMFTGTLLFPPCRLSYDKYRGEDKRTQKCE